MFLPQYRKLRQLRGAGEGSSLEMCYEYNTIALQCPSQWPNFLSVHFTCYSFLPLHHRQTFFTDKPKALLNRWVNTVLAFVILIRYCRVDSIQEDFNANNKQNKTVHWSYLSVSSVKFKKSLIIYGLWWWEDESASFVSREELDPTKVYR